MINKKIWAYVKYKCMCFFVGSKVVTVKWGFDSHSHDSHNRFILEQRVEKIVEFCSHHVRKKNKNFLNEKFLLGPQNSRLCGAATIVVNFFIPLAHFLRLSCSKFFCRRPVSNHLKACLLKVGSIPTLHLKTFQQLLWRTSSRNN